MDVHLLRVLPLGASSRTYANAGWNRLSGADNGQGGSVNYTYEHIAPIFTGQSWRNLFKDHHRVISKSITTAPSGTAYDSYRKTETWQYVYDNTNGKPNYNNLGTTLDTVNWSTQSKPNSAALYSNRYWFNNINDEIFLLTKRNKEYRGHPYVKEIAPDGSQIEHWYYMGDIADESSSCPYGYPTSSGSTHLTGTGIATNSCFQKLRDREFLKGKEYQTRYRGPTSASSPLLKQTNHSFSVDFYAYPYGMLTGLWRAFSYESQTAEGIWNGTSTPLTTTSKLYYTSTGYQDGNGQFGNLTKTEIYSGTQTIPYKVTENYYATRNIDEGAGVTGSYIVDRVWMSTLEDGSGNLLSLTHNFYDGNNTGVKTLGVTGSLQAGRLTRSASYYDVPANDLNATLHGSDRVMAYDTYGNVTSVTSYDEPGTRLYNGTSYTISSPGNGSAASTTTTAYDDASTTTIDEAYSGLPRQVTNALSQSDTATYDYRMQTLSSTTNANSDTTSAEYDIFGRLVKVIKPGDSSTYPTLLATYFDTETPFRYKYELREVAGTSPTRILQQYYNGAGQAIQTKTESQAGGHNVVVDKRYDGLGRVSAESQPRYEAQSGSVFDGYTTPGAITDPLYRQTTTTYDGLGRPLVVTTPDSKATTMSYDILPGTAVGPVAQTHMVDANRHRTSSSTDAFGRLTYVTEFSGDCGSLSGFSCGGLYTTSWQPVTTTYSYDRRDQLVQSKDALNNISTMTYDTLGRKTAMSDPDMGQWYYGYDTAGQLISQVGPKTQEPILFSYDALGRLSSKLFADSLTTSFSDSFTSKDVTKWSWTSHQTVVNESGNTVIKNDGTEVDYAATMTRSSNALTHGEGMQVRFKLDTSNPNALFAVATSDGGVARRFGVLAYSSKIEVQACTSGVCTGPKVLIPSLQLNSWYVLQISVDDQAGMTIQIFQESDPSKRGSYSTVMAAGKSWGFTHAIYAGNAYLDDYKEYAGSTYTYDGAGVPNGVGQRTSMKQVWYNGGTEENTTTSWEYNNRGLVTRESHTVSGLSNARVLTWSYDSADRITSMTYPNTSGGTGEQVTYTYDAGWRQIKLYSDTYGDYYLGSATMGATYTALDQPEEWLFDNGVIQKWSYDTMARLSQLQVGVSGNLGQHFNRSYSYDNVSNLNMLTDNKSSANSQSYLYDHLNRLTSWTLGSNPAKTYSYNAIGNLLSKEGTSYTYGTQSGSCATGALTKPHAVVSAGSTSYCYDKNGNMTHINGSERYTWTAENLPASITGPDGILETYRYDAEGSRVRRVRNTTPAVATYTLGAYWEENGLGRTKRSYALNGTIIAIRDSVDGVSYIHGDHLGSVSLSSSPAGVASPAQEFDPWGQVRAGSISLTTLNFTGQKLDATGLLYYNARMYDPVLGRFLSADSIVPTTSHKSLSVGYHEQNLPVASKDAPLAPLSPQRLNRYSYVLNNPLVYKDPSGHDEWFTATEANDLLKIMNSAIRELKNVEATQSTVLKVIFASGVAAVGVAAQYMARTLAAVLGGSLSISKDGISLTGIDPTGASGLLDALEFMKDNVQTFLNDIMLGNLSKDAKIGFTTRRDTTTTQSCRWNHGLICFPTEKSFYYMKAMIYDEGSLWSNVDETEIAGRVYNSLPSLQKGKGDPLPIDDDHWYY